MSTRKSPHPTTTASTTLACVFCPTTITFGTDPHTLEYFFAKYWTVLDDHVTACPRCAPILRTLKTEFAAAIDELLQADP